MKDPDTVEVDKKMGNGSAPPCSLCLFMRSLYMDNNLYIYVYMISIESRSSFVLSYPNEPVTRLDQVVDGDSESLHNAKF